MISFVLLIVGGLNWLLYAFGYNLVTMLFSWMPTLVKVIYILVGLAALYEVFTHKAHCKDCAVTSAP